MKSVIIIFAFILNLCNAYRLLVAFPFPSRSHAILGEGFVNRLTRAGHNVTYITPYPIKNPPSGLRQIEIASNRECNDELWEKYNIEEMRGGIWNNLDIVPVMLKFNFAINNGTISNQVVQKLMLDPKEKFDAIIVEWMYSEIYAGFAAVFDCPLIWSSSIEPHAMVLSLIDEMPNPAYTPDFTFAAEAPLSFWERVKETAIVLFYKILKASTASSRKELYKNIFGPAVEKRGRKLPSYEDVVYNASLMFGNSHVASGSAIKLPQNYKAIGGYHIPDNIQALPENFKNILDNAKNGVIYFSLGTTLKSTKLPNKLQTGILEVFRELEQTVIWKFESELTDVPKNVHIVQWAPQQGILAHSNCVLFITHGGLLSVIESLHFGVPIIGIPLFADQFINIKRAERKGFAKEVTLDDDMPNTLKIAIEEVVGNPRYTERALELSLVYHDRPVTPGAELVHWVEHVVKTRGAPHLRSPAILVPWYQKMFLDIFLFITFVIYIVTKIIKYLLSFCKGKVDLFKKNN